MAERLALSETFSSGAPLEINPEFSEVILSSAAYETVYLTGLRLSYYNFVLSDYSYFQFSYDGPDRVRYAYYPNPFLRGESARVAFERLSRLAREGQLEIEDFLNHLSERKPQIGVPPIRYENAPDQYRELEHPCSHFHLGFHSDNRWPVARLLAPLAFSLLVYKLYYGDYWRIVHDPGGEADLENALINAKQNSRMLAPELFSDHERRSVHFT